MQDVRHVRYHRATEHAREDVGNNKHDITNAVTKHHAGLSHDSGARSSSQAPHAQPPSRVQDQQQRQQQRTLPGSLTFHPAYCYRDSPTWFKWVKLTAHDIHHELQLHSAYYVSSTDTNDLALGSKASHDARTSFAPPINARVLFYLNHPIQFVQLVGVVVAVEEYYEKFWLFTIDDSSGETIEVNCRKPAKSIQNTLHTINASNPANTHGKQNTTNKGLLGQSTKEQKLEYTHARGRIQHSRGLTEAEGTVKKAENEEEEDNDNNDDDEDEDEARTSIMTSLSIGNVVQVKGRITTFRQTRQIQLERIFLVPDTNAEMQLIASRTTFKQETLSHPWTLSQRRREKLLSLARDDQNRSSGRVEKLRRRKKDRLKREERHHARILDMYQVDELAREEASSQARNAGIRLRTSTRAASSERPPSDTAHTHMQSSKRNQRR